MWLLTPLSTKPIRQSAIKLFRTVTGWNIAAAFLSFSSFPPSSSYAGTLLQTHPDAGLWDAAATLHRPSVLFADVRLRQQGARGSLAVWRRKRGLAHPLSFPSLRVPSQQCFFSSTSRWLQSAVFVNAPGAEAAWAHSLRHQQRQRAHSSRVRGWGAVPAAVRPPSPSAGSSRSHALVPPGAAHCFLGCRLCDTLMFTFCISS